MRAILAWVRRWLQILIGASLGGIGAYFGSPTTRPFLGAVPYMLGLTVAVLFVLVACFHVRLPQRATLPGWVVGLAIGSVLVVGALLYEATLAVLSFFPATSTTMTDPFPLGPIVAIIIGAWLGLSLGMIVGLGEGLTLQSLSRWWGIGSLGILLAVILLTTLLRELEVGGHLFPPPVGLGWGFGFVALGTVIFWGALWGGGKGATWVLRPLETFVAEVGPELRRMGRYLVGFGVGYAILVTLFAGLFAAAARTDPAHVFAGGGVHWTGRETNLPPLGTLLYLSVITFPPLGYSDLHPTAPATQFVATLELIVGVAWTLIVFTALVRAIDAPSMATAPTAAHQPTAPESEATTTPSTLLPPVASPEHYTRTCASPDARRTRTGVHHAPDRAGLGPIRGNLPATSSWVSSQ